MIIIKSKYLSKSIFKINMAIRVPFHTVNHYFVSIDKTSLKHVHQSREDCLGHHHHHHHPHVVPPARITLTLSYHFSLSFKTSGWSTGLHPVSSHSCRMYVRAGRPYVEVHMSTSLMSLSCMSGSSNLDIRDGR